MIIGPTSSSYASYIPIAQPAATSRMVVEPVGALKESNHEVGYDDLQRPSQSGAAFKQALTLFAPDHRLLSTLSEVANQGGMEQASNEQAQDAALSRAALNQDLVQSYGQETPFAAQNSAIGGHVNVML